MNLKNITRNIVNISIKVFATLVGILIGYWIIESAGMIGTLIGLGVFGIFHLVCGYKKFCKEYDNKEEVKPFKSNLTVYLKPGDSVTINGQYYFNDTNEMMTIFA